MPRVGLPAITGFILVGAACGPYSLNIVEEEGLKSLSYINMFALAFITTSAGAELIIADLKPLIVTMLLSVTCISILTFGVSTGVIVAVSNTSLLSQLMDGKEPACKSAIAMIMATIGMARSPATAIAIVKELRCKGKMTTTFLGITVLSDIFVLIGITITMSFGKSACAGGEFKGESIGVVIAMIIVSVLLGLVVGLGYIALMMSSRFIVTSLIFPFGFLIFLAWSDCSKVSSIHHVPINLMCKITVEMTFENFYQLIFQQGCRQAAGGGRHPDCIGAAAHVHCRGLHLVDFHTSPLATQYKSIYILGHPNCNGAAAHVHCRRNPHPPLNIYIYRYIYIYIMLYHIMRIHNHGIYIYV